jgi:hypothetical protein
VGAFLERLWRGQVPLVSAFWDWGILGGLLVHAVSTGLFVWALNAGASDGIKILAWGFPLPYSFFVLVGVWRSAGAYTGPPWRQTAARWAIVIWTAITCLT